MELKLIFILVFFTDTSHQQVNMAGSRRDLGPPINSLANKVPLEVFRSKPRKNLVVSPLAMKFPLCKLAEFSSGDARDELMAVLGYQKDKMLKNCYKEVKNALAVTKESDLILLEKIYINERHNIRDSVKINSTEAYGVPMEDVTFKFYKQALRHINGWFENLTYKRIQDVLLPHEVNSNSSLIIVNAAHYKGSWENQFDLRESKMGKFMRIDRSVVSVPMMHKYETLLFNDLGSFRVITLLTSNWAVSMTIVLPQTPDGIRSLLSDLQTNPEFIRDAKKTSKYTMVKLQMPRFKIKSDIDFTNHLKAVETSTVPKLGEQVEVHLQTLKNRLACSSINTARAFIMKLFQIGIQKIFNNTYSGLNMTHDSSADNVYLSKAKQKIFIDIDEYGVFRRPRTRIDDFEEQAHYGRYNIPPKGKGHHVDFKIDKPFLFTINILAGDEDSMGPDGQGPGRGNQEYGPLVNEYELFIGAYYGPED